MSDAYSRWLATWPERMARARAITASKPKHRHQPPKERKPMSKPVDPQELATIRELAADGRTSNYIGQRLNRSGQTIRNICRNHDIALQSGVPRTFDHDEAIRRYQAGERASYIAYTMGITYSALDSCLDRAGVVRRQRSDTQFRAKPLALDPPAGEQFPNNEGWQ